MVILQPEDHYNLDMMTLMLCPRVGAWAQTRLSGSDSAPQRSVHLRRVEVTQVVSTVPTEMAEKHQGLKTCYCPLEVAAFIMSQFVCYLYPRSATVELKIVITVHPSTCSRISITNALLLPRGKLLEKYKEKYKLRNINTTSMAPKCKDGMPEKFPM